MAKREFSKQEAESQYQKAAQAEVAKDFDKAFRLYLSAADQFLHLSRQVADNRLRTSYYAEAEKSLQRAEKIKAAKQNLKPGTKDALSEGEQSYILKKSSLVNEGCYPLWDATDRPSASTSRPPLSPEQIDHGASWRKIKPGCLPLGDPSATLDPEHIMQHIVSDCSVCGAMAVALDHHRRFGSKIIVSSLYPQDANGLVTPSETGQYHFRAFFNGAFRRVAIDDQLPTYPDGTLMCVSTGEKGTMWPSLVEKAYMKLAGGYDFLGSDSSTDLHVLAGWIPEVLDLRGPHFQREKTWNRFMKGYVDGKCVATLGTGERVRSTDSALALLPAHCYAIIGVDDSETDRRVTIFDPWVHATAGEDPSRPRSPIPTGNRVLTLTVDAVYQLFDGIYFSWDPAIFKHSLTLHGMWKREGRASEATTHFRCQAQFENPSNAISDEEVWILLTRHVRSHRAKDEFIALTAESWGGLNSSPGKDTISTKGEYTNSPHVLVKTSISRSESIASLVASYEGERDDVGFTITAYSNSRASWIPSPQKLLYSKEVEGAFTQKTAGGNHTHPTYYLNPQFHLRVHPCGPGTAGKRKEARDAKSSVSITLSTDRHVPVNTTLVWSQGARINELAHNDLALSSGPYSYGYAHAAGLLSPGDYTLVVSAFEPSHIGKFALRLECSERLDLTPILQEGAGMFSKVVRGEWTDQTAGGGPSSGKYTSNPMYELQVSAPSQLRFRLQLVEPSPSVALNLTVFNSTPSGSALGRHIATSGPYSDSISGVTIDHFALQPGRYMVVPSIYKAGILAGFRLIVYSSVAGVQLGPIKR